MNEGNFSKNNDLDKNNQLEDKEGNWKWGTV